LAEQQYDVLRPLRDKARKLRTHPVRARRKRRHIKATILISDHHSGDVRVDVDDCNRCAGEHTAGDVCNDSLEICAGEACLSIRRRRAMRADC
jgi:hypothetical protein